MEARAANVAKSPPPAAAAAADPGPNTETPLRVRLITCPVCQSQTPNCHLPTKCYTPGAKETDSHVLDFTWRNPAHASFHPPFYVLNHCSQCGYTDFSADFQSTENRDKTLQHRYLDLLLACRQDPESPVALLMGKINPSAVDFFGALSLHLLALHIQRLTHKNFTDHEKIARLYLRINWLHRDREKLGVPAGDPYWKFLGALKARDEGLPLDEGESLEQAIAFYRQAIEHSPRYEDPVLHMHTVFLIADLLARMGRYDEAVAELTAFLKTGSVLRSDIVRRLYENRARSTLSAAELRTLQSAANKLMASMLEIRERIVQIRHRKLDSLRPRIVAVLAKAGDAPGDECVSRLIGLGLTPQDIQLIAPFYERSGPRGPGPSEIWDPAPPPPPQET